MNIKFINKATSLKIIAGAKAALAASPNMWPGPKAGFKALITAHTNLLAKNNK